MKLSLRLKHIDFIQTQPYVTADDIAQAEELERKAESWDLLEKLPRYSEVTRRGDKWAVIEFEQVGPGCWASCHIGNGDDLARAIQNFWETRE
jgi:hypothetical protein